MYSIACAADDAVEEAVVLALLLDAQDPVPADLAELWLAPRPHPPRKGVV